MGKSKTFLELSKSIEVLNENAQGQLKGGFAVFSSNDLSLEWSAYFWNYPKLINALCRNKVKYQYYFRFSKKNAKAPD